MKGQPWLPSQVFQTECAFSFGRFRLLPGEQILLEDEKPVRLGSRALDILTMLVEHAGELVSRDELTARGSLIRMIGRDAVTNTLSAELPRRRFITIVQVESARPPSR
jgi:DNA-binding response OmpR family regulator